MSCVSSRKFIHNLADYVNFGAACCSVYVENPCHKVPFLLAITIMNKPNLHHLYSVTDKRVVRVKIPIGQRDCHGSGNVWLITVDYRFPSVSLLNPFSCCEIHLPYVTHDDVYLMYKAILSADPMLKPEYIRSHGNLQPPYFKRAWAQRRSLLQSC